MNWTEKYRPTSFAEVRGQEEAIKKIKSFIEEFSLGKLTKIRKKSLLLYGPPGTGKTALAHITAKETNAEIFELNASDLRNKEKLKEILRPALEQKPLIKSNKIILVDEVDGITGADWGGVTTLQMLIETTTYPVIMSANDAWSKKLAPLRKKAELVKLKEIPYNVVKDVLIQILKKENLFVNNDILTNIAVKAKGDLRAALNDLQTISKVKDPSSLKLDERNKETDIFNALRTIFKTKTTNEVLGVFDNVNISMDETLLWLEENIFTEYKGQELAKAYDALSKADIFKGRIYKQQYWRFLVYENVFLTYGISAAKKQIRPGFTSYKKPDRILKIWLNNQRTAKKKSIAQKYAHQVHVGQKRALKEFVIIKPIIKSNEKIQKELKLSEEEITYLNKL